MLVVAFVPVDNGFSETVTDRICAKMASAAKLGDAQSVIRASRDVDNLWPDSPEDYFQVVLQTIQVLADMPDSPATKQCLSNLFVNVSEKNKPGNNTKHNTAYFEQKGKTYLAFLGFEKTRKDKFRLLAIALFIGEIRANMIADYVNLGTSRPGLVILEQAGVSDACKLTDPAQIDAYEKAVKANKEDMLMNELQSTLRRNDRIMTFHLLHSCARLTVPGSDSTKFENSIIKNAHLSQEEAKQLRLED